MHACERRRRCHMAGSLSRALSERARERECARLPPWPPVKGEGAVSFSGSRVGECMSMGAWVHTAAERSDWRVVPSSAKVLRQ